MAKRLTNKFDPDWTSHPGDSISDALDELGITSDDLAMLTGLDISCVESLIQGHASITNDIAARLEATIGGSQAFWLSREMQHQQRVTRKNDCA